MNQLDLTKFCALCGGELMYHPKLDPRIRPNGERNDDREWLEDDLEEAVSHCPCTDKATRGPCGKCAACRTEQMGCSCDGAYDIGCFLCRPGHFERPPCPIS